MLRALLALALAAASPAAAGTMLYATAATTGAVTGYCLGPNGAIDPNPIVNVATHGKAPSRIVTSPDGRFLYVGETNMTEVWAIGERGQLQRAGQIPERALKGMNSHDIAVEPSPDGSTTVLYLSQRQQNRIAAFPLDPTTGLSPVTTPSGLTCVRDTAPAGWESLVVANGLVYAARTKGGFGEVAVYQLGPDGNFLDGVDSDGNPVSASSCTAVVVPYAQRRKLNGAAPLVLLDDILYVGERFRRAISSFQLCPNQFSSDPAVCPTGGFFNDPKTNNKGVSTNRFRQPRLSRTHNDIRYNALALAGRTILGAQFQKGRIDAFSLSDDGSLPSGATRITKADIRTSPFRMFVNNDVLYVGAGANDRAQAYRLDANGLPESNATPFSQTDTLRNTFPNEVRVVDISGTCD